MKILFVDDENAYESCIAEKIAFDVMEDSDFAVETFSRGLNVPEGKKMGNMTAVILAAVDLEPNFKNEEEMTAHQLTKNDIDEADVVLTMTHAQKEEVSKICPDDKLFTLLEYTMDKSEDLPSPKGYPMDAYKHCLCGIGEAFGTLLERLQSEKGND